MSVRGYTWKIALRQRRKALPLLALAPLLPPRKLPERPIFVIGCPRSGTTLTVRLITRAPGTCWLGTEGHVLWESFHHPRAKGWESGALDASDIGSVERRYLAWAIPTLAGRGRFVDKTPRNTLRLPYLDALFPRAQYVFVFRDGRAIVSSLYEEWPRAGRIPYRLPEGFALQGTPARSWRFVLPSGWRELNGRPVEEACAHVYVACTEAMLAFRDGLPPERYVDLRYEDLLDDPTGELGRVFGRLDLELPDTLRSHARDMVRPAPATPPWTTRHASEIERVLPTIAPMLERTGYRP
jgi:hypothetical protein